MSENKKQNSDDFKADVVRSCNNCQNAILTTDEYGYSYMECLAFNKNLSLVDDKKQEANNCKNFIGY